MRRRILLLPALMAALAPAARGQTAATAPAETAVAAELTKLNATLTDIKTLLERLAETQGLDLLMKRMELSSARVTELESRLRGARAERTSVVDERARLQTNMEAYLAELERRSREDTEGELEAFTLQFEAGLERFEARLRDLDDEIARLENLLDARRRELEDWQGYIDRRLGGV
ncbi:MAG: hypothetical protein R3325_09355 [Thermoanaerobaculia bacterium]|nr:hypothetical protein [Thermoanaerobaculia bacterium]